MTGLKSGSGDDLWSDEGDDEPEAQEDERHDDAEASPEAESSQEHRSGDDRSGGERTETEETTTSAMDEDGDSGLDVGAVDADDPTTGQPYIVRRALQDKSVQFERDERLTFFVHDDVVEGERDLVTDLEAALGRDVPKFDVREAVYRAALRHPDAVLEELVEMGYSLDDE